MQRATVHVALQNIILHIHLPQWMFFFVHKLFFTLESLLISVFIGFPWVQWGAQFRTGGAQFRTVKWILYLSNIYFMNLLSNEIIMNIFLYRNILSHNGIKLREHRLMANLRRWGLMRTLCSISVLICSCSTNGWSVYAWLSWRKDVCLQVSPMPYHWRIGLLISVHNLATFGAF